MSQKNTGQKQSSKNQLPDTHSKIPSSSEKSQLKLTFFLVFILIFIIGGGLFWGYSSGIFPKNKQLTINNSQERDNEKIKTKAQPRLPKINPATDIITNAAGFEVLANVVEVVWKSPLQPEQQKEVLDRIPGEETIRGEMPEIPLTEIGVTDPVSTITLLKQQPEVQVALFDYVADPNYEPLDPDYQNNSKKWWLETIEAEQAWDINQGDPDMTVAVIDGGFQLDHPDLLDQFDQFLAANYTTEGYDESSDHGTHVSGIIAMEPNDLGLVGIAPNVNLMPIKIPSLARVADAIRLATDNGGKVISISQGFNWWYKNRKRAEAGESPFTPDEMKTATDEVDQILLPAIRYAKSKDVVIVHSAGNDGQSAAYNGMNTSDVITVANSDSGDVLSTSSNFGAPVTLASPGSDIWSSVGGSAWDYKSGTSMATPLVAGTVALVRAANPKLTVDEIITLIQQTGERPSGITYPRLDAWQALLAATNHYGVKGKVVDKQGNPVASATVQPKDTPQWEVRSKPDGTFALAAIPRTGPWEIEGKFGEKKGNLVLTPLPNDQWVVRDAVLTLRSVNEPQFDAAYLSFSSGFGEEFVTTCQYTDPSYANILGCDAAGNCTTQDPLAFRFDGTINLSPTALSGPFTGTLSESWAENHGESEIDDIVFSGSVQGLTEKGGVTLDITGTRPGADASSQVPIHAVVQGTIIKVSNQNDLHFDYLIRTDQVTIDPYTIPIGTVSGTCSYSYDPATHSLSTTPERGYFSIRVDYTLPSNGQVETDPLKGLGL